MSVNSPLQVLSVEYVLAAPMNTSLTAILDLFPVAPVPPTVATELRFLGLSRD